MITVTFTELRNNARKYFDAVERGESIEVCRHGKPVAMVTPVSKHSIDRWGHAEPARVEGIALSKAIIAERRESR